MAELNQLVEVQTEALNQLEVRMDELSELLEVRTEALDKAEDAVMRLEDEVDHLKTQLDNVKGQETAEVSNHCQHRRLFAQCASNVPSTCPACFLHVP
jgi:predicted nuclease with TOPRIM domain